MTSNASSAGDSVATLIMIDGQGRPVPWQANGYFDGDDGGLGNLVVRKKDQSTGQYDTVQSWLIDNRMTVEQNRTLVLFHELGHLTGVLGDDRKDSKLSGDFNKRIAHDCFGKK